MNIVKVIVDVPASSIDQTFDYKIPERFQDIIQLGMRVTVPFGPRKVMGFVVETVNHSTFGKLKEIIDVLDIYPVLTKELLDLGKWVAQQTVSLQITALQVMLPQVLKATYKKEIVRMTSATLSDELEQLFAGRDVITYEEFTASKLPYVRLSKAVQDGDVSIEYLVKSRITKKFKTMIRPARPPHELEESMLDLAKNAKKQKQLLAFFIENPEPIEKQKLLKHMNTSNSTVNILLEKKLLDSYHTEVYRNPYQDSEIQRTFALPLTVQQAKVIEPMKETIEKNMHDVFLLHGITGSGKTEVYLQVIQDVILKGQEAIVLVPEISLTPQMVRRFKGRFGSNVAVMHSALSAGEKYDEWRRIQRKEVQVVVGARSAIFAPFENIGVIIIDEEHETSYKQEDQPRYHARDVAIQRGKTHQCPVILGSATPTLESYARAAKGVYQLATLDKRTNEKALPPVEIVDMRKELHAGNRTMFSRKLKKAIIDCIEKGEQVVLLLNRRGYSTFVMCRDCGHVKECPHCDIALTYHKNSNQLKCHYCSYEEPMPLHCPECNSDTIRYFGTGTQRVEEALTQLIPEASVIRMDVDTTRRKGAHEKLLNRFANKEADILLGTQMIAKGLDFENVTLVGVLTADSMLHLPDFRSSEKTFQILTQVSGRAGRHNLNGNVIVQTYTPDHYSIELASQYDFSTFYNTEMKMRKAFQYPPYFFLALITISHVNQVKVVQATQRFAQLLTKVVKDETIILGPTPSAIPRIKDRYRYQCMIKYRNEPDLRIYLSKILDQFSNDIRKDDLFISIDMQPYHLM
ncbi:MAG: primosomal protein N' [Bacillota bacterium]|uniref:Replication restart protein PriA n=1 Tax=Virgibacillus salarius TaxID=447199 RepID=A0A941DTN1_9BACI|nr:MULTISPECIES: primosomal protein N' [Bacillaceae]NAZ08007.1 primosomal protein N' [Agaribacter marinus]MBR7795292.1 primosomal protein N' [Virgibacillus salarius]MCC2251913.1 primosomal protein N' [Virgibacillus sp. AGTR]MDY7045631.1 primosomal protein N' [Virgibacillus sp. M23]QRZ17368.1 primosomal protein N' [Virgibacillus sp. AGTR]